MADATLDNNQEGKDYARIMIEGYLTGFAFGAMFSALGAIREIFATVKYWIICQVKEGQFRGSGDSSKLEEIIKIFKE